MDDYFRNRAEVDDPDLLRDRRANDIRLKSRFEHIFAKYEKDFTGVGDEIDLESGEIIVNNGHLSNMRHEVDPGKSASSRLVGAFTDGDWEDESGGNTGEDDEGDDLVVTGALGNAGDAEGSQDDDGRSSGYSSSGVITDGEDGAGSQAARHEADELSSDFYPESADLATREKKRESQPAGEGAAGRGEDSLFARGGESSRSTSRDKSPDGLASNVTSLTESLQAIQTNHKGTPLDEAAIQALGQSIASQLAQYMKRPPTKSRGAQRKERDREPAWKYPALPTDKRRRTATPPTPQPFSSSAALFTRSPGDGCSIWAPVQHPKPHKRPRTTLARAGVLDPNTENDADVDPLQSDPPHHSPGIAAEQRSAIVRPRPRECANCGETKTPDFSKGPNGEDICNACGMYFYRYGLLKPPYDPNPEPLPPPEHEPQQDTFSDLIAEEHGILPGDEYDIPVTPEGGNSAAYPANTARRVVANGVRMSRWTTEEDEMIIKLREVDNRPWKTIGRIVSGRSAYAVQCRYSKKLHGEDVEARRRLLEHCVPVQKPRDQLEDKDLTVIDLDEDPTGNSANVTPSASENPALTDHSGLPNASALARSRMDQRDMRTAHHDLHDGQYRGFKRFTDEENETIIRLREAEDMSWEEIHRHLPERTPQSLQKHYGHELQDNPLDEDYLHEGTMDRALLTKDKKRLRFSKEEDEFIVMMKEVENMPFAEMTQYLSERTEDALSRRYTYIKSHALASKQATPRPRPEIKQKNGQAARQFSLPYPDSTPYQQVVPGSSRQPSRGRSHVDCSHNIYGRAHPPDPAGQGNWSKNVPKTPAGSMQPPQPPLRPTEVGPSAWAVTQPASKGPLPFQPARKSTLPIQSAPRWPVPTNPFDSLPRSRKKAVGPGRDAYNRESGHGGRAGSASAIVPQAATELLDAYWQGDDVLPSQLAHSQLVLPFPKTTVRGKAPFGNRNVGNLRKNAASSRSPRTPVGELRARAKPGRRPTSSKTRSADKSGFDVAPIGRSNSPRTRSVRRNRFDVSPLTINEPDALDDHPQSDVTGAPQVPTPDPTSGPLSDSTDTPRAIDHTFSVDEDKLIKKWREEEGAPWSQIAERLPHHTQQAVTDRYYDLTLGNSKSVKTAVALNKNPLNKHGRQFRGSESAKVLAMRDQGLTWKEMAEQLPGRTAKSVANHFFHTIVGSARVSKWREATAPGRDAPAATPLLRRALGNAAGQASGGSEREPVGGYDQVKFLPPGANGTPPQSMSSTPPVPMESEHSATPAAAAVEEDVGHDSIIYERESSAEAVQSPELGSSSGLPGTSAKPQHHLQAPPMPRAPSAVDVTSTRVIDLSQSTKASQSHSPVDQNEIPDSQSLELEDLADEPMAMDDPRSSPPTQRLAPFHFETPLDEFRHRTSGHEVTRDLHGATSGPDVTVAYETPGRFNHQALPYFIAPAPDRVEAVAEDVDSELPFMDWHRIESDFDGAIRSATLPNTSKIGPAVKTQQPKKRGRPPKSGRPSGSSSEHVVQHQEGVQAVPKKKIGRPKKMAEQSKEPEKTHLNTPETTAPTSSQASALSNGRRKYQATPLGDPPISFNLISLMALAIRSHPEMCMYTREITDWIAEHHPDQAVLSTTIHFHLSVSRGFTNVRPGEYQPLWTLTDEIDGGVGGRGSSGKRVHWVRSPAPSTPEIQPERPAGLDRETMETGKADKPKKSGWGGRRIKGQRVDGSAMRPTADAAPQPATTKKDTVELGAADAYVRSRKGGKRVKGHHVDATPMHPTPQTSSSQPATTAKETVPSIPADAPAPSGRGGKRVMGYHIDGTPMYPTPSTSSSQPATARKETVNLTGTDAPARQPKRSAQAFDSDEDGTLAASKPGKRRSLPVAKSGRPAKKVRREELRGSMRMRRVVAVMPGFERERTSVSSGESVRSGSVVMGPGNSVLLSRDGDELGDEDELA